jgi:hypothetical protein
LHRTLLLGAALCGALSACTGTQALDLNAVKKYADTTEKARASFNAIAADFDASCQRSRELLIPQTSYQNIPPTPAPQAPNPVGVDETPSPGESESLPQLERTPSPRPTRTPYFGSPAIQEHCIALTQPKRYPLGSVSRDWKRANDAVLDYVKGLGAIAGVDSDPKNIEKLTGSIVDAKLMNKVQATAVNAVARGIVNYFAHNAERRSIAGFMNQVSGPFPTATAALLNAAAGYEEVITAECTITDNFYINALVALRERDRKISATVTLRNGHKLKLIAAVHQQQIAPNDDPVAVLQRVQARTLRSQWVADRTACFSHLNSADAYIRVVKQIDSTQERFTQSVKGTTNRQNTAAAFLQSASDLGDAVNSLYALLFPKQAGS